MPKELRSKRRIDSDEDFNEFSGQSDASFNPMTTKKRTKSSKDTSSKRRRTSKSKEPPKTGTSLRDEPDIATSSKPHATSDHVITDAAPLQKALLAWYAGVHEARGMPWRKPYNPAFTLDQRAQRAYEVWISEIMLQQTQVVTVIPYYNRWMARFPTIKDLAASDIETVNALWKGLGYYSRAARLLSAAKKVVDELDGRLPDNAKDMEAKIPGIGRYSAGAICSIAYNECVPVLDGNVNRLMSRLLALHANPKAKPTLDILWAGAEAMVSGSDQAGDINQALIELGATVCKVRDPDCSSCPLQQWCKAYRYEHAAIDSVPSASSSMNSPIRDEVPDIEELCGQCEPLPVRPSVTAFPMKVDRKKAREELDIVNVVEWRRNTGSEDRWFLLVKRPEGGLLAGLHEFPTLPDVSKTLSTAVMQEVPQRLLSNLLTVPLQPFCRTAKKARSGRDVSGELDMASTNAGDLLRITSIRPAGDVIHVFSHIRKTYRIQWVLLEGGGSDPPSLTSVPSDLGIGGEKPFTQAQKKAKKVSSSSSSSTRPGSSQSGRKASSRRRDDSPLPSLSDDADPRVPAIAPGATVDESLLGAKGLQQTATRWLLMKDVSEANIGTGVLKVWKQVSTLWASDAFTGPEVE